MKNLVILSGAGISAESGLNTFRDHGGLWENHSIYDVATPEAWAKNPAMVLRFYNDRRAQLRTAKPNAAHFILQELESHFNVHIITQNVDDLHERAGSTNVLHLHGQLLNARSSKNPNLITVLEGDILLGDTCALGSQLRPDVVWFGEDVPAMAPAEKIAAQADVFVVIGTSLNVYPAAGLLRNVPNGCPIYVVDPQEIPIYRAAHHIKNTAVAGAQILKDALLNN